MTKKQEPIPLRELQKMAANTPMKEGQKPIPFRMGPKTFAKIKHRVLGETAEHIVYELSHKDGSTMLIEVPFKQKGFNFKMSDGKWTDEAQADFLGYIFIKIAEKHKK